MPGKSFASRARDRIIIEEKNLVDNGRGGRKRPDGEPEWKPAIATPLPAEIIALRGGEALTQAVQRSTQVWRVAIRLRHDVNTTHRVRWGAIAMNIRSAAPNEDRTELVMTCESGAPD